MTEAAQEKPGSHRTNGDLGLGVESSQEDRRGSEDTLLHGEGTQQPRVTVSAPQQPGVTVSDLGTPAGAGEHRGGGGGGAALRQGMGAGTVSSAASSPRRPDLGVHIGTRGGGERGAGTDAGGALLHEGSPLRAAARSPNATGLQTFGSKYMPFAAGFSQMAGEAAVYRSSRLHTINPTAAVSEDTSYLYTLDSGAETPATRAANPHHVHSEHVRNTASGTHSGGFMGKVFSPIR